MVTEVNTIFSDIPIRSVGTSASSFKTAFLFKLPRYLAGVYAWVLLLQERSPLLDQGKMKPESEKHVISGFSNLLNLQGFGDGVVSLRD